MDSTAPPEYEESWSPLRLGLGLVLMLIIGGAIYCSWVVLDAYWAQESYEHTCMQFSKSYAQTLRALAHGDSELCRGSHAPADCVAEITHSTKICEELSGDEMYRCIFAATKDLSYCFSDPAWCDMLISGDPSHCSSVPPHQVEDCIATAKKDADAYLQHHQTLCYSRAWNQAISERAPFLLGIHDEYLSSI